MQGARLFVIYSMRNVEHMLPSSMPLLSMLSSTHTVVYNSMLNISIFGGSICSTLRMLYELANNLRVVNDSVQ
jgi:hypothetical protein